MVITEGFDFEASETALLNLVKAARKSIAALVRAEAPAELVQGATTALTEAESSIASLMFLYDGDETEAETEAAPIAE